MNTVSRVMKKWRSGLSLTLAALGVLVWPASALAATDPGLGTAGNFAVLAGTTVTNTGPTWITGELGVAPGSAVTGFPPPERPGFSTRVTPWPPRPRPT